MIVLLFKLLIGHALADFALQSDAMARGKNRHSLVVDVPPGQKPAVSWPYWLGAHALIHAGAVLVILGPTPVGFTCGIFEFVAHGVIDFLKCENVTGIHQDQGLHVMTKMLYVLLWAVA